MILETPIVFEDLPSQHMLGFIAIQPCLDQQEDGILKRIDKIPNDIFPPIFPMEEAYVSTDQEIIVETLHPQMMVMSCSQSMALILFQVTSYLLLGEEHEHRLEEVSTPNGYIKSPTIECMIHNTSSCAEDIDQMVRVFDD